MSSEFLKRFRIVVGGDSGGNFIPNNPNTTEFLQGRAESLQVHIDEYLSRFTGMRLTPKGKEFVRETEGLFEVAQNSIAGNATYILSNPLSDREERSWREDFNRAIEGL